MVKTKIIIVYIIVLSVISCLNFYRNSDGALRPNKINFKLDKNQSLSKPCFIDTLSVYELYSTWLGDYDLNSKRKDDYVIMNEYRYYDGTLANFKIFLRFYNNGNLSFFHIENESGLNKESFNPAKGILGVYSCIDNKILIEEFSFRGHQGSYLKSKARVKGDTIHLVRELSGYYTGKHNIFIKKEVPNEYLDWKSDW
ncbi:hypothetical protein CJ739_3261 [Mariniflexile rhizosphaerae]|uniref:hypothetical protein n=1 Tax=unclassified Mariniflexile TaxID=2643887 RepID=UPI000CBBCAFB|nr:hypothetical protein [Mariniflexile sp. TRM1-10]AXP82323.1 hypothetical protein CJ739_3261 [Mariniflexile sp. TRM1-10]PLB20420.1 MAG: hypothetical protein TRG1_768 [Flavobacteriaceae bacterium FS1-H7996/R]